MSSNENLPTADNESSENDEQLPVTASQLAAAVFPAAPPATPSTQQALAQLSLAVAGLSIGNQSNIISTTNSTQVAAAQTTSAVSLVALLAANPVTTTRPAWGWGQRFLQFAGFPKEIRIMVWHVHADSKPCLVYWKPGGRRPPKMMEINLEARQIALEHYMDCQFVLNRSDTYHLYINFAIDTLFREQRLPNLQRNRNPGSIRLPLTMDVVPGFAGPAWNVPDWGVCLRSLCIKLPYASANSGPHHTRGQTLWTLLRVQFPNLEELIIYVPGPDPPPFFLEDLVDLPVNFGTSRDLRQTTDLSNDFVRIQGRGILAGVQLHFRTTR